MPNETVPVPRYCSFIVRFWFEPADGRWYGEVEHVQSRAAQAVMSLDMVQQFMQHHSSAMLHELHSVSHVETDERNMP